MDATIIAGSLNDRELKSSIDSLVSYVDEKVKGMATNFDNELKRMKTSLQNLGNIKIDGGSASDSGSERRTKRNADEAKSVRETTVAYEQLALATQKAMQPKSAEQSFYAFIQNYREHAAKLASELKAMPSASLDRQIAEYERFEREINNTQRKIQELRQQLNEVGANPNRSRFEIKAITDEIALLENKVKQLTAEQISSTRRIANEDNMAINQKRALYERTVQLVKELTTEQNNSTNATKKQNEAQDQLTRKIQRQAEIIRQRLKEEGNGFAFWGTRVIYDPNDARNAKNKQAQLSIEQQLLKAHQEQVRITQERIASEQRANQAKKETVSTTQAQAQAEQQVTQAQRQRNVGQSAKQTFQTYESFTQALAHVLGLQQQEIRLADSENASYNRLQQTLKTLQAAYNQLSNSERNSENGRALVASMHEVQRAMQKIQSQAARPVNLMAAMGLSEKTLDDINYKMQMLSRYRNGIDLTNPKSKDEIKRVNEELSRLKETQNKMMGTNTRHIHSNELLGRSFDYIKNRIAFVLTVGTITQFTKSIYEIRGQYELLERSIGILFDSMQQGSQIFAELNAMAIKSPFTTMELGAAAKQLSAYDIAAKDVVDTTRRLADMAAAVGVPIERLTYALGQIKAYGYLNARDARMFANAGIPLVQNLADMYTKLEGRLVSVGDIYDRIKKKAISFEDVLKVVNEMTDEGGRFFNFQEKAADTLKVKLANLTLAYNNMLNEIGKSNQTLLTAPLVGLKKLYENWRNINNIIKSLIVSYGLLKGAQILYIAYTSKVSIATAAADVASKKLVGTLYAMKGALVSLASNPFTWITVVLASLGYMYFQMRDLNEATEQFNKSISQNAQENIDSINKFFNEYKKDIDSVNSLSTTDQQKMWERIKEEIEKTSKSAQSYIDILEKIPDISGRIKAASESLSQIQQIQQEVKRLAEHGFFSVGGGFADDGLADDLTNYEKMLNYLIQTWGSFEEAQNKLANNLSGYVADWTYYDSVIQEAKKELDDFTDALDKANLGKILGDGTNEEQLANLREFTSIIRENFLATEKGQKISSEGRALLNKQLDEWVAKQGVANGLLNDEYAQIESNRTAWETFFEQLNKNDKETIDYLVSTNQTGSEEFKKIWDKAANSMKDSAITSYQAIQDQIAELRNTPDIVINVVYKQTKEQLDDQQQQFKNTFLEPKGSLNAEEYFKQVKELNTKYGRFQKKQGENNVEWEKRLGEIYRDNESSLKRLNAQLENSANLSDVDRIAKTRERDALVAENEVLDQIKANQNFNYEKDKESRKGGNRKPEDVVAEALKQELQLIREMQSNYDKLRKSGVSNMDAIDLASKGYEATIIRINQVLSKFGIDKFNAANFAGKDVRSLLQSLEEQRQALLASGKVKTSSLQALDVEIQKLTVDAKTYDMKKVTDGLNSELGKIKDEYELAIELDANPELGNVFADLFDIDTESLPHTIDQYADNVLKALNKSFNERNIDLNLPTLDLTSDDIKAYKDMLDTGILDQETFNKIKKSSEEIKNLRKKDAEYTFKQTQELQYKLADTNGKIAIEEKKLSILQEKYAKETQEEKKRLLELQIQDQQNAIAKLEEEVLQLLPTYMNLFNSIAEHSTSVTRRIAEQWKDALNNAVLNTDGRYTITDPLSGEKTTITAKEYGKQIDKVNGKLRETQTSGQKIKEAFTKGEDGIVDWLHGLVLVGNEISNIANGLQELSSILEDVGIKFSDDINYAIEGLSQVGSGVSEFAQGFASGNYIQAAVGGIKAVVGLGKTVAGIFGGTKKDYFTELNNSLQGLLDTLNKVADYQLESLSKMTGSKAASEYRKLIENNEMAIKSYRDLANARGKSGSSWGSHSYAYRTNRDLKNDWAEISKFAGQTITSIQDMYNLSPENLKEIMTNMPVQWSKIDGEIRKALESIIEYGDKANEYTEALGVAMTNMSLDDLTNDFESMLQDMDSDAEEFSENFEEYMRNAIIRSMMVGTYASELENWYNNFKRKIADDQLSDSDIEALREEYMDIVNRAITERDKLLSVVGTSISSDNLSALQQGIQSISEDTASALEAYMNGVSQQVYLQSDILTQIRDAVVGFDMDVQLGVFSQMLLQLQQSYVVQQNIERLLQNVINPSGRAFMVELAS